MDNVFDTVGTCPLSSNLTLDKLSDRPRIWLVEDFLSDAEAKHLIGLSEPAMGEAITVDPQNGYQTASEFRTSSSYFISMGQDHVVSGVEERIAQVVGLPKEYGEDFNILHYVSGQRFDPHHDYFDPGLKGLRGLLADRGQRFLTMLLYLSDVEGGGETWFPKASFSFAPRKRAALIFYNVLPNGDVDPSSLHGSHAVTSGEKWVATKWLRERAK